MLLSYLRLCGCIPEEFIHTKQSVQEMQINRPIEDYDWANEGSIDFSLCRLAFDASSSKLEHFAEPSEFGAD